MSKTVKITEEAYNYYVESKDLDLPSYFTPEVNQDGTVTVYHGLKDESLDYVLMNGELTPHMCSEGVKGIWFSIKTENDYPSGYHSLVSFNIPISEIGRFGSEKRFSVMNSAHLFTENSVSINEFDFKIIKICGLTLDDETINYLKTNYNGENPQSVLDYLDKICPTDALYYYILNLITD